MLELLPPLAEVEGTSGTHNGAGEWKDEAEAHVPASLLQPNGHEKVSERTKEEWGEGKVTKIRNIHFFVRADYSRILNHYLVMELYPLLLPVLLPCLPCLVEDN